MQENNGSDSINDILDSLSAKSVEALPSEEFVFGEPEQDSGLVFDDSHGNEAAQPTPLVSFEKVEEVIEKPIEFSVPEKFEVNKKYDTPAPIEDAPRIITTYVPRFTEASQSYRMKNDPRPKFVREDISASEDATAEYAEDNIDPTAELDGGEELGGVSVNIGKSEDDELESATKVFKFTENELPREHVTVQQSAPEPEPMPEPEESLEKEETVLDNGPKEYRIPDPIDPPSAVAEYTVSSALAGRRTFEEAPDGVGDRLKLKGSGKINEYISYAQRDSFKDRFIDTIMSMRVRFFATAAIALLLLVVEAMFAFGVDIPLILNLSDIAGAMALLDMQFIICLYLIAIPETVRAIRSLLRGAVAPELFLTASFIANIAYTVVIVIYSPRNYPLFGLLFAISAIAAIGASYFGKNADFTAFKRISQNGEKTVIDIKPTRTLERENAALDGAVEEHKSKTCRVFRTAFVSDFFTRLMRCSENTFNVLVILVASFGVALVTGLIALFLLDGLVSAASAFVLVFMLATPAMSIMLHKIPYYHAAVEADSDESAVIGEAALCDYSGADVVTFEDTEVFGNEDVTLQRIMLYGHSDNLTKALRQMSALFMNVGGPLDILFSDALDRKCSPAHSVVISDGGIEGEIDGKAILAGTKDYMLSRGIRIPEEDRGTRESLYESTKVMYAAEDGEVYAKFYIRYSFSEEFSMLLPSLEDAGITPLVYTRDPNVTPELMITLTAGADKIRVLKKKTPAAAENVLYRKVSAGMVTFGDKSKAINMILLAKKYSGLQAGLAVTELIVAAVGGALAVVLSLAGMSLVPSFVLAAWQAAQCGAIHILSKRSFNKQNGNTNVRN